MLTRFPSALAVLCISLLSSSAWAQSNAGDPAPEPSPVPSTVDSRADQPPDADAQATDQPPPVVRKVRNYIQNNPIVQRLQGDGFYPRIGGLSQGSGLAGGIGYRLIGGDRRDDTRLRGAVGSVALQIGGGF